MVVPGLYGYVSATKWVTSRGHHLRRGEQAYWTPLGWSPRAPRLASRIDVPRKSTVDPGGCRRRSRLGPARGYWLSRCRSTRAPGSRQSWRRQLALTPGGGGNATTNPPPARTPYRSSHRCERKAPDGRSRATNAGRRNWIPLHQGQSPMTPHGLAFNPGVPLARLDSDKSACIRFVMCASR